MICDLRPAIRISARLIGWRSRDDGDLPTGIEVVPHEIEEVPFESAEAVQGVERSADDDDAERGLVSHGPAV